MNFGRARHIISSRISPLAVFIGLSIAYLVSRTWRLTLLPVFVDEAVHIEWAATTFAGDIKSGLWVGKWLPVKVMAIALFLPTDELFAVRMASVIAGFFSLVGIILVGRQLFSVAHGLLAALLYIIIPFALFYDRLALADSYVAMFGIWTLLFSILLIDSKKPVYLIALVGCLVFAVLSKLTGVIFAAIPLLTYAILSNQQDCGSWSSRVKGAWRIVLSVLASLTVFALLYNLGAGTHLVNNQTSSDSLLSTELVLVNLSTLWNWGKLLLTPPIGLAILLIIPALTVHVLVNRSAAVLLLISYLVLTLLPYVALATTWYPRYLLSALAPIVLLLSWSLLACYSLLTQGLYSHQFAKKTRTYHRALLLLGTVVLLVWPIALDSQLLNRPEAAKLPAAVRHGYFSGWPSGYGLPEAAAFLEEQAQKGAINVARYALWAGPNLGLNVYLSDDSAIQRYELDPSAPDVGDQLLAMARERKTFFVSDPQNEAAVSAASKWDLDLSHKLFGCARPTWHFERPEGTSELVIWEIVANDCTDR